MNNEERDIAARAVSKSVFYVCVAIVLIFLIQSTERVMTEFIKSTVEPPTIFMVPGGMPGMEEQPGPNKGKDLAENS